MMKWFDRLLTDGPTYGQFPEPSKTTLVVQSSDLKRANDLFHDFGVCGVTTLWFVGGYVGRAAIGY